MVVALRQAGKKGSRRYLESLSTYTRRRMTQAAKAQVDDVRFVPATLALHQRPGISGIRSTFGTSTELLNSLRLMYSRLASHRCPNGHYVEPTMNVAAEQEIICPLCGEKVLTPSAEELAFNSAGACRTCDGTGIVRTVDESTLVPDESLTIDEGAVAPWQSLMWSLMKDIAREMGIRTNIPFRELSPQERELVFHGPADKKHILYFNEKTGISGEMDFTYFNAVYTVENALSKVKDEKGMKRVEKFLKQGPCPNCGGTRLCEHAQAPRLRGISLDQACEKTLSELVEWVANVPESLPEEMRPIAESICESFQSAAKRLIDLGLSYLSLDRASSTLSTGERQRTQLARAVRNRTTGVLYVLDESSIGLHPSNIFDIGEIRMSTGQIHTVQPLEVRIPKGQLSVVTGVSGSGKTTMILESLVPGLEAAVSGKKLPRHVRSIQAEGICQAKLIDATPIGINVRSTVATYANVHDELRKIYARTAGAKEKGYKAGDFSYNTGKLRCPTCDGTGAISLDVQFLPDVNIPVPIAAVPGTAKRHSVFCGQKRMERLYPCRS